MEHDEDDLLRFLDEELTCSSVDTTTEASATGEVVDESKAIIHFQNQHKKKRKAEYAGIPKRTRNAYIHYVEARRDHVRESLGNAAKVQDVMSKIAEEWRRCSAEEKRFFEEAALRDKERYEGELKDYQAPLPARMRRRVDLPKDPAAPKRAPSAFLLWSQKLRSVIRQGHQKLKNADVSRMLGEKWRALTDEEKAPWKALAEEQYDSYRKAKADYVTRTQEIESGGGGYVGKGEGGEATGGGEGYQQQQEEGGIKEEEEVGRRGYMRGEGMVKIRQEEVAVEGERKFDTVGYGVMNAHVYEDHRSQSAAPTAAGYHMQLKHKIEVDIKEEIKEEVDGSASGYTTGVEYCYHDQTGHQHYHQQEQPPAVMAGGGRDCYQGASFKQGQTDAVMAGTRGGEGYQQGSSMKGKALDLLVAMNNGGHHYSQQQQQQQQPYYLVQDHHSHHQEGVRGFTPREGVSGAGGNKLCDDYFQQQLQQQQQFYHHHQQQQQQQEEEEVPAMLMPSTSISSTSTTATTTSSATTEEEEDDMYIPSHYHPHYNNDTHMLHFSDLEDDNFWHDQDYEEASSNFMKNLYA